jgi:anthranilate phosphoribosyltransferase
VEKISSRIFWLGGEAMIKEAIGTLVKGQSLSLQEAAQVMEEIMDGKATSAQLASFITALRIKGETADELAGLAGVMREKAVQVKVDGPLLDVVGTGGDGLNTFNISTAAAFVAAGAGIKVAKHGNRAASSLCGSADVLEKLGVRIDLNAGQVEKCIQDVGIGFMFAPNFHPAMKYAAAPRREIGIRTVFNILGPLTNPAHAEYQVIGVPDPELIEKMVHALLKLGAKHALVVHGLEGMDEISISGPSIYQEVKAGEENASKGRISPEDFGMKRVPTESIKGGTAEENARTILRILEGSEGPERDIVVLNASAALLAGSKVKTLKQGVILAQEIINGGLALAKLKHLIEFTRKTGET